MATSVASILLEKEILLESGTNELEILVFRVAEYNFGINVAKVREVLPAPKITSLPKSHRSVVGVFRLRDVVVPCVSLYTHLGTRPCADDEPIERTVILTDFNNHQTAFLVDEVERIHRLSWKNILSVPSLMALANTPITAVARIDNRLIIMLDFEMISDQVTEQMYRTGPVENPNALPRGELKILFADDSPTVREAIASTLQHSGYTNLTVFENGADAWQWIQSRWDATEDLHEVGHLLISDVEMPQVDGFHLCKRIKEHPQLKRMPVLLYSSIVSPDNHKKGVAVGADAQVSKPQLRHVVELADNLIAGAGLQRQSAEAAAIAPSAAKPADHDAANSDQREHGAAAAPPAAAETPPIGDEREPSRPHMSRANRQPPQVSASLMATFRAELADRLDHLRVLCDRAAAGERSAETVNDAFRTLHTIKSAAMVVPCDEVARLTHLMEGQLEPARSDAQRWPLAALDRYLEWLGQLVDGGVEIGAILAAGGALTDELAALETRGG